MSILLDAITGKTTRTTAEQRLNAWLTRIGLAPGVEALTADVVTGAKQTLSDAISMADSALDSNFARIVSNTETALTAELAALTKGATIPLNGLISDGIDRLANAAKKAADLWALEAKANLAPSPVVPASATANG